MALIRANTSGVGGGSNIKAITGTWTKSTNLSIPTEGKAKSFTILVLNNGHTDTFEATDGVDSNHVVRDGYNGRYTNWATATFGNSSIDLNQYYTSSADVTYTGYITY